MKPTTLLLLALLTSTALADDPRQYKLDPAVMSTASSPMRPYLEWFQADRGNLTRFHTIHLSPNRQAQLKRLHQEWLDLLPRLSFDSFPQEGKIDYLLFKNYLTREQRQLTIRIKEQQDYAPLLPFAETIIQLEEARKRMVKLDPAQAAETLNQLTKQIDSIRKHVNQLPRDRATTLPPLEWFTSDEDPSKVVRPPEKPRPTTRPNKQVALRAAVATTQLQNILRQWHTFHTGYDPLYSWWCDKPYDAASTALANYATFLRESIAGVRGSDEIVGDPIGKEMLASELDYEMVPYTPDELITIANEEFAWCEAEMKKAAKEMGLGDDWKSALEKVKTLHVGPGDQPAMIKELALEAIDFVTKRDLVTVPDLARYSWRMEMMTPERQLVAPFFLGGEVIQVAFPTAGMTHEQKLMSMRGNNRHFARATVHHELIPGHHLQGFMTARIRQHRELFRTPFWLEGWALYWEMLLYDIGFPKTPEDRIGMLFWRMHRCARILFSLNFHLGKWTPKECIDFLVDRVGHERDNATAEVRRSFSGAYGPLYQAAYMLGGLQIRALRKELVDTGKMTDKTFHDAILRENSIPIEMVRASLTNATLTRDFKPGWKWRGEVKGAEEKK
jgi:hypothetical protein